eukprot:TRINITY_DN19574_c0_g1_i1.p1 TRINITY_DN19574_c0_g1~~TRINITY_DN19574_c0_g1_i1.p1  ORF type:complete len:193 (+),score=-18.99 TRINITY_DN19574_c0_g1_i1:283-861(+)
MIFSIYNITSRARPFCAQKSQVVKRKSVRIVKFQSLTGPNQKVKKPKLFNSTNSIKNQKISKETMNPQHRLKQTFFEIPPSLHITILKVLLLQSKIQIFCSKVMDILPFFPLNIPHYFVMGELLFGQFSSLLLTKPQFTSHKYRLYYTKQKIYILYIQSIFILILICISININISISLSLYIYSRRTKEYFL